MRENIIIYGATKERAFSKLQQILDKMEYGDVANVKKSSYEFVVVLKNDDVYRAVGASDIARGIKWQYAYIDSLINREMIDRVILPSFMPRLLNGEYDTNTKIIDRVTWY